MVVDERVLDTSPQALVVPENILLYCLPGHSPESSEEHLWMSFVKGISEPGVLRHVRGDAYLGSRPATAGVGLIFVLWSICAWPWRVNSTLNANYNQQHIWYRKWVEEQSVSTSTTTC